MDFIPFNLCHFNLDIYLIQNYFVIYFNYFQALFTYSNLNLQMKYLNKIRLEVLNILVIAINSHFSYFFIFVINDFFNFELIHYLYYLRKTSLHFLNYRLNSIFFNRYLNMLNLFNLVHYFTIHHWNYLVHFIHLYLVFLYLILNANFFFYKYFIHYTLLFLIIPIWNLNLNLVFKFLYFLLILIFLKIPGGIISFQFQ